ncbi:MAG: hypothetical protein FJ247_02060 [Nitrospira sp.]|nr:hypothetical protein [Nitrospira sp.]
MKYSSMALVAVIAWLAVAGCATQPLVPSSVTADEPKHDRSILAGEWEHEDGATVTLRLDQQGNGTYPFKGGRFETSQLTGHTWEGRWSQKENDREGGFSVKLSNDYSAGEGTWWYVRIGTDKQPTQKGGTFRLNKKASLTQRRSDQIPIP